jgi:exonuclease III
MVEHFSILNWNVWGLNSPARREVIRDLVQTTNPKIVCLQETKVTTFTQQLFSETCGQRIDGYHFLLAVGTKGGILLEWNSDHVEVSQVQLKEYSLTVRIRLRMQDGSFQLTVLYGPSDDAEKSSFLEEFAAHRPPTSIPWLVLGEFNLIYEAKDKNNLNLNRQLMGTFR